jgi:ketosteroid isomerase-like protein
MTMKSKFTLFLMIGLLNASTAQSKIKEEIKALEKQEVTAFVAKDFKTLDILWAKDFIVTSTKNKIAISALKIKELLSKGIIEQTEFERTVEEVTVNNNIAVSMGHESARLKDGSFEKRRYTNIWVKYKNSWKLTAAHHSLICN